MLLKTDVDFDIDRHENLKGSVNDIVQIEFARQISNYIAPRLAINKMRQTPYFVNYQSSIVFMQPEHYYSIVRKLHAIADGTTSVGLRTQIHEIITILKNAE
jgi:hypothetical protein